MSAAYKVATAHKTSTRSSCCSLIRLLPTDRSWHKVLHTAKRELPEHTRLQGATRMVGQAFRTRAVTCNLPLTAKVDKDQLQAVAASTCSSICKWM